MPLHDWTDRPGWEGLHIFWMTEIARALRADLPAGYRAVIGSSPLVAIGSTGVKPDVAVTNGSHPPQPHPAPASTPEPDVEVAVATLEEDASVQVERDGRLIAVVELVSPRNKDRPTAREQYAARLEQELPAPPAPSVVSYRVGPSAATGGRMLAVWQHPLEIGTALPRMPLALTPDESVMIDLESTYSRAAADSYVS